MNRVQDCFKTCSPNTYSVGNCGRFQKVEHDEATMQPFGAISKMECPYKTELVYCTDSGICRTKGEISFVTVGDHADCVHSVRQNGRSSMWQDAKSVQKKNWTWYQSSRVHVNSATTVRC